MMKKTKVQRIKTEKAKLRRKCSGLSKEALTVLEGLLDQAAFLKIELEDMREELSEKGWVEFYQNSKDTDPFERDRPLARQYIQSSKIYQTIIKQLAEKIEKTRLVGEKEVSDGFDDFAGVSG